MRIYEKMYSIIFTIFLSEAVFAPCHNLDTETPLQDFLRRWLKEENGTTFREFNILSQNWRDPDFISTNPCITFTIKGDTEITANFKEE